MKHDLINPTTGNPVTFYPSLGDFLAHVNRVNLKAAERLSGSQSLYTPASEWYGGLTFDQAHKTASEGSFADQDLMELREYITPKVRIAMREAAYLDVTGGSEFSMGAFTAGEPECVWNYREEAGRARKTIGLFCNVGALAVVNPETMRIRGAAYMALVDALEKSGKYSCQIYAVDKTTQHGDRHPHRDDDEMVVQLKSSGHQYDPSAVGFALCHPSFFRVLCFGHMDLCPNATRRGLNGGRSMRGKPRVDLIRELIDEREEVIDLADPLTSNPVEFSTKEAARDWVIARLEQYNILDR